MKYPAPWTLMKGTPRWPSLGIIVAANGEQLDVVSPALSEPDEMSVAHLIAAAPELLEACRWALQWFIDEAKPIYDDEGREVAPEGLGRLPRALVAAIKKAEGRE